MSFAVGGVVQRMRWIPPGTFLMGSPAGEPGRWDAEGPQHQVTFSRGFWLADTPCTQALWQVVMGENPSRFKSPDRPVEMVSWDDCQRFLSRIGQAVPGLRLPTEAEWEYACRAGTTGMTWLGDFKIRGENNAPGLDSIAWYGGNSGKDFDLDNGYDSSDWPNKQYEHTRAGTRPVARKAPNPYGLYDMLGNVWEWCEDNFGPYDPEPVVDPPTRMAGSDRVIRGGSWGALAGSVRAAARDWSAPGGRDDYLGLRLLRGQGAKPASQVAPEAPQWGRRAAPKDER